MSLFSATEDIENVASADSLVTNLKKVRKPYPWKENRDTTQLPTN